MPSSAYKLHFGTLGLAAALLTAATARAQFAAPGTGALQARSYSGQFVISGVTAPAPKSRLVSNLETNQNFVRLDPTILPVSCERIKQLLVRELGLSAPWSGKIYLSLYSTTTGEDPVTITSTQFRDGWRYRLELPDMVRRLDFVRAVVQVLLLEVANRGARDRSAEIPPWLSEGLCQQVLVSSESEVILPPPRALMNGLSVATKVLNTRWQNPLEQAHKQLQTGAALSFQQLSWPTPEQMEGEEAPTYRSSAQLFVNELLRLNDGRACFRTMLAELPQHYNWQFAFLHAFRGHFQRPVEVEKWWALHLEHFTGRELAQTWPEEESWQKLDETLRSAVQVRFGTNELPMHTEVKLQTVIREWDRSRQTQALQAKLRELEILRLRLATNFTGLVDEYHQTLTKYLQNRDRSALPFRKKAAQRNAAEQAIRELEALDSRRFDLRTEPGSAAVQAITRAGR